MIASSPRYFQMARLTLTGRGLKRAPLHEVGSGYVFATVLEHADLVLDVPARTASIVPTNLIRRVTRDLQSIMSAGTNAG